MSVTRAEWADELLKALGAPRSLANRRAIIAWETAEGTAAKFNPLATTLFMPNSTNFNSVGVKSYARLEDGLNATLKTLEGSPGHNYHAILHRLRRNDGARAVLGAVAASDWGTGELALSVLPDVRADLETYGSKPIGQ